MYEKERPRFTVHIEGTSIEDPEGERIIFDEVVFAENKEHALEKVVRRFRQSIVIDFVRSFATLLSEPGKSPEKAG